MNRYDTIRPAVRDIRPHLTTGEQNQLTMLLLTGNYDKAKRLFGDEVLFDLLTYYEETEQYERCQELIQHVELAAI